MSNLIPEKRVNKNGIAVTKHVKPSVPTRTMASLPSPTVSEEQSPLDLYLNGRTGEVALMLRSELKKKKYRLNAKAMSQMLDTLHEDTIGVLERLVSEDEFAVRHGIAALIANSARHKNFADLNNVVVVADVIKEHHLNRELSAYVSGLQMLRDEGIPLIDWSKEAPENWVKPQAVVNAIKNIHHWYVMRANIDGLTYFLKSPRLHDFILDRPHDVDRIVEILNDRKLAVTNDEQIESLVGLLDQKPEKAIAEGIL